jgi:hypothetical protein
LLFLPFASGVSPWRTLVFPDGWVSMTGLFSIPPLALIGAPFFLSIPILVAQTRLLLKRPFSKGERATYRLLACAALAAGLAFLGVELRMQGFSQRFIPSSLTWLIPFAAAVWMMILSAMRLNPEEAATVTMQAAWLPNAIYCAIGSWNGWEIGADLAAFTAVLYTVEITLSMRTRSRAGFS